jgi:hypothetical protein
MPSSNGHRRAPRESPARVSIEVVPAGPTHDGTQVPFLVVQDCTALRRCQEGNISPTSSGSEAIQIGLQRLARLTIHDPRRPGPSLRLQDFSASDANGRETAHGNTSNVVARAGIEPATFRFSGGRSYRLSYLAMTGRQRVPRRAGDPDGTRTRDLRRDRAAR